MRSLMTRAAGTSSPGGGARNDEEEECAFHVPALPDEVATRLVTNEAGLYVDGTLGGGGHSATLLKALGPDACVLGIDRDGEALEAARRRIDDDRFEAARGNFADLPRLLSGRDIDAVDGLLLDLGISSHHVDAPERGFSYRAEGDLDMRMDRRAPRTAAHVVNDWSERDLRDVLYEYGEERNARRIARAVTEARPLETTTALAEVVREAASPREEVSTLSRVFQAIRIAVNGELDALERILKAAPRLLKPGARTAVISYHSLEDRRVKRFFRYGNLRGEPVRDLYGNLISPWRDQTRSPVRPDDDEVEANPRSRSARLRVAERRDEIPDRWSPNG